MIRRRRALDGLEQEMRDHIERDAQERIERGVPPEEARRQARIAFGNVELAREDTRAVWVWRELEVLLQDLRLGVRTLRRNLGFTTVIVLTLALGIGANTAIFSLLDQVLLRMLAVHGPAELVLLEGPGPFQGSTRGGGTTGGEVFSVPMFRGLQAASGSVLNGMLARFGTRATVTVGSAAERVATELVSGDYFRILGIGPALGRTLGPEDDRATGAHPVVVLSYGYWQGRFGGDAGVLEQAIRVNGHPMTIAGVAAPGFSGVDVSEPADVFVPLMMKAELTPTWNDLDSWRSRWVTVMGRLGPGVSRERAAAALNVTYRHLLHEDIETARLSSDERTRFLDKTLFLNPGGRGLSRLRSQFAKPLTVLMSMVALVLLIACANVANLLLARAVVERRDIAVRLALGAGRLRVVRQRLTESFVLAAGGALVGLLFAWWTTRVLIDLLPFDGASRTLSSTPDLRVAVFATGVATATALVFGLAPALQATRPLSTPMNEATGTGPGTGGVRKGLVVAQVALSVLLLAGAGLFARSLYNLRTLDPGFVSDDLLQFSVDPALSGYSRERSLELVRMLREQLGALPGVTSASMADVAAMSRSRWQSTVRVQGYESQQGENMNPTVTSVGSGYFATMGIPLLMGREFRPSDDDRAPLVAVVNETMAKYFWGDESPIGRRFGWAGGMDTDIEVVGVVADSKFTSIRDEIPRFVYVPLMQAEQVDKVTFYARHRPGTDRLSSAAGQVLQRLDPNLPIFDMRTMAAQVDESLFLERLVASLSILFGGLATMLAAVGLYGVMSYTVSCRTREIGLRMALGAERAALLRMVLGDAIVVAVAGILLGLSAALALTRLVESQLFGLSPTDPMTLGGAATVLGGIALLAAYLPARRAMQVDPMRALRCD